MYNILFVAAEMQSMKNVLLAIGNQKWNMWNFGSGWLSILIFRTVQTLCISYFLILLKNLILLTCRGAKNHSFSKSTHNSAAATITHIYTSTSTSLQKTDEVSVFNSNVALLSLWSNWNTCLFMQLMNYELFTYWNRSCCFNMPQSCV